MMAPKVHAATLKRQMDIVRVILFEHEDGRIDIVPIDIMSESAREEVTAWFEDKLMNGKGHTIVWRD